MLFRSLSRGGAAACRPRAAVRCWAMTMGHHQLPSGRPTSRCYYSSSSNNSLTRALAAKYDEGHSYYNNNKTAAATAATTAAMLLAAAYTTSHTKDGPVAEDKTRILNVGSFFGDFRRSLIENPFSTIATTHCEKAAPSRPSSQASFTPSSVGAEDFKTVQESHNLEDLPVYTSDEVAQRNGADGTPIWMSYGGVIYDVTEFIHNHPGGSEKIIQAAGSAIEPFWHLYRQHFASDLPIRMMEHMAVGQLDPADQEAIDAQMEVLEADDPYVHEPTKERDAALKVHSDTPMNAEVPTRLLTASYLTPTSLFYIRHHHPVPLLTEKQLKEFCLKVDVSALYDDDNDDKKQKDKQHVLKLSLEDLQKMPQSKVTVTMQCSGNRRGGYNAYQRTSGTPWGQGAISTAEFVGVKLRDVLKLAGLEDPEKAEEEKGIEHVIFHALDGMQASIGIEKATNPFGDCIIAYEMNGEPLPRDHGFPLRVIVPGYAAVRNVKWVERIEVSKEEAEGPWQRGLNYKMLPPAVTDAKNIKLNEMPSLTEQAVFSGITAIKRISTEALNPGDRTQVKVGGWAFSGGGRNVVRVDVSGDNGATWATADLKEGSKQRFHRAWAWTFWECELPVVVQEDGTVHVASKAVDLAFNSQPEKSDHTWNVRGLANNSWYRAHARVL